MLINRLRSTDDESVLYHYCSPETFLAVIQSRTIRFSDLHLLNDVEEGRYGYYVFVEAANKILGKADVNPLYHDISKELIERVDATWSQFGFYLSSFVACFSTDGDSLSQWRAYASDAAGFALGFRASEIRRLPVQLLDVQYDRDKQVEEMMMALGAIYLEWKDKGNDYDLPWFHQRCTTLAASAVALKNPAWRDEKEVRAHHVVDVEINDSHWLLRDEGGVSVGVDVPGQPVHFQSRGGTITPYVDMPFDLSEERLPLVEVVLGPKCSNEYGNVRFALGNSGFRNIGLKTAGAGYR